MKGDMVDLYLRRKFPKKWQEKIDAFAQWGADEKCKFGRAMFYIGMNIKAIRKRYGVE